MVYFKDKDYDKDGDIMVIVFFYAYRYPKERMSAKLTNLLASRKNIVILI